MHIYTSKFQKPNIIIYNLQKYDLMIIEIHYLMKYIIIIYKYQIFIDKIDLRLLLNNT